MSYTNKPEERPTQSVTFDTNKFKNLTVTLVSGTSSESGVAALHYFDAEQITAMWQSPDGTKLFYDNAKLLYGSAENPGSLYAIDVVTLDKLLGSTYGELQQDLANEGDDTDDQDRNYKTLVVSITDGGGMLVHV